MALNIWAFEKDLSIKHLLLLLRDDLPRASYLILDEADTDSRAVRLRSPRDI